jgi:hypothetical protein
MTVAAVVPLAMLVNVIGIKIAPVLPNTKRRSKYKIDRENAALSPHEGVFL